MRIVDFLIARTAEGEAILERVIAELLVHAESSDLDAQAAYERQMLEYQVHRRIISLLAPDAADPAGPVPMTVETLQDAATATLQLLAMPYADHPDYKQDWKVD
ncbi:DUF6221 family protein [Nocardioides iriomotensis]|uniref:Uncharacterized protein n=1 Tax=Nocardioides iriomotensis TaxID=715784 RepID=A0A4Q5J7P3_9ACTN|nr:DUF6221 family protein [Nocardioides iriomotensis]RYU14563.1 hypothetical protein ETU37_03335 [Nocardioides iriomotensis]